VTSNLANSPKGVTDDEASDAGPSPLEFVATAVNVYGVPAVSPSTVHDVVTLVHVKPSGDDVTVYPVIADVPVCDGAPHTTSTSVGATAVAPEIVGAPGVFA